MTRGEARSPGTDYLTVVAADPVAPPAELTDVSYQWVDADRVTVDRYVSQEIHDLEAERLWPHVWQMACRLEHIPNVGDHLVYDICDLSYIVVRVAESGPAAVKAYANSCLHRGTTLVNGEGNAAFFKCPFHGFAWNLDGSFRGMPAAWDFPHVDEQEFCLPEAQVTLWGGFVMINPDPDAPSFEQYSGALDEHFTPYPLDNRYVAFHTAQVVDANWKTTQEAFLEGYHVSTTHQHTLRFANDFDCKYDVFGENVSRLVQALALPATHLIGQVEQGELAGLIQKMLPKEDRLPVPDDVVARPWLADRFRESLSKRWRTDLSGASEAEILDSIQYFLFPNFCPWGGYALPIVYRFRPFENDPNRSIMEMQLLHPIPEDGGYTTAEPYWLEPGESWTHSPGFEALGMVIDQDMDNLPNVQKGLRAARHDHIVLSDYQEIRIRHFHRRLDEVLGLG
ncbi:MAG: aromatic ring-hydroxylating dioxygenase subunit alpha [Actinomycetota bacterium]|jgi:hypothetical protein|nr:aromatic ring-hydroxylating dioxygenase subunit alpha [Actinomycetota bacterium]